MATWILAGTLLAKPGEEPLHRHSIRVEGGHIVAVEPGFSKGSAGDEIVDLSDQFVLPGLIDCHVHLTAEFGPRYKIEAVEESAAAIALHADAHARATLQAGFTTVHDLGEFGGAGDAIFALRNAVAQGFVPGPRIFAAGAVIAPTGGHGITCGYREDINALLDSSGRADGVAGCRAAVRRQVHRGADFVKFVATGGVLTDTETGTGQQFFADEFDAIVSTAHMMGRKATAHAHGADGIKAALRAGVDSIEHGSFMDDEGIDLMLKGGAVHVPTALAGATVAEQAWHADFMPPAIRKKALEVGPQIVKTLAKSYKAGVKIAFGTDTGVSPHGQNAREFALMVKAGMSPMAAIAAATRHAAEHIGQASVLGSIEPGKFADVVAVTEDPLSNIDALLDMGFVMKAGIVYKRSRA